MLQTRKTRGTEERSAATGTRLRFELGTGWLGRWRSTKRVRPLQISEVIQAVEEHLRAAALSSLKSHYLPTRLTIRISDADWRSLRPFEGHLRQTIGDSYRRLAEQPKLAVTMKAPVVTFDPAPHLSLGDPPVLESSFDDRAERASWWPGKDRAHHLESLADVVYSDDGIFEVLITASPRDGTARQTVSWICLDSELPLRLLDPAASSGEALRWPEDGGSEGGTLDDGAWRGDPPERLDLVDPPSGIAKLADSSGVVPALLFRRSQCPDVLWVPGGTLVIGRESGRAHWVPDAAPRNLSASHLALALDPERGLEVVDLASTNGVYLAGARLSSLRPTPIRMPAALDVGTEGTMRLEIRAGIRAAARHTP